MTTTQPNDTNVLTNPTLTANLLHAAYGTSISISVHVLAEAVFYKAFNTHIVGDVFAEHIRQNLKAYAFNLSEDAIDIEVSDEPDFFDGMLETIRLFKGSLKDPESNKEMNGYMNTIRTLRKAGQILTVG